MGHFPQGNLHSIELPTSKTPTNIIQRELGFPLSTLFPKEDRIFIDYGTNIIYEPKKLNLITELIKRIVFTLLLLLNIISGGCKSGAWNQDTYKSFSDHKVVSRKIYYD